MLISILFLSFSVWSSTLFEAYSKILSGGIHVGFVIQKYEFDGASKKFYSTYYLETNQLGGAIIESLKAQADQNLRPLSYRYTRLQDKKSLVIDATIKNSVMNLSINRSGNTESKQVKLPPKTFLGTFLTYVILRAPKGMQAGIKYDYSAVAEEDGSVNQGFAHVKSEQNLAGHSVYRILNQFKDARYIFMVTPKGETLATKSPLNSISTEVARSPAEATAGFSINAQRLKLLFGEVPRGNVHPLAKKPASPIQAAPPRDKKPNG